VKKESLHSICEIVLVILGLWSMHLYVGAWIAVDSYFYTHPEASRGLWELPVLNQIYSLIIADQGYKPAKWLVVPTLIQIVLLPTVINWWDNLRKEIWSEQYGGHHSPSQHGNE